ncbi:MAG: flagellar biosynthesis protein FlhB [Angelakisella sp.]
MAGEKTEKATPKRKQDERKKGNIFQSKEIVTVASLMILFSLFKTLAPVITAQITGGITNFWAMSETMEVITVADSRALLVQSLIIFGVCTMPLLLASILVAVVFTFAQTKMMVNAKSMEFKFSRLNPISGLKKLFSMRGLVELFKAMIKISVLGYIIYDIFIKNLPKFPRMFEMQPVQAVSFLSDMLTSMVNTAVAIFAFLAVADYVYQWWDYEKNLRMSKDEIKEEYKQTEGDPQIKGKIKEKQRQISMSRMMQNVPTADVVVRNPTHYAVAIKYDAEKNRAPVVVAKGVDELALRIVKVAEEAGVTITENVPLARGLYASVDIDREIPDQFYQPVAEVLAFVYNLKAKKSAQTITPQGPDGQ